MNVIKKVTVFVMGLVVIGVLSTTIGVTTQSKTVEKSVTFELLENGELAFNVYDKINEYAIYDNDNAINLVNWAVNGDSSEINNPSVLYFNDIIELSDVDDDSPNLTITSDNIYSMYGLDVGDIITITFEVEVQTPAIIKTLLVLIPLVFTASLIGYLSLSTKKGE